LSRSVTPSIQETTDHPSGPARGETQSEKKRPFARIPTYGGKNKMWAPGEKKKSRIVRKTNSLPHGAGKKGRGKSF